MTDELNMETFDLGSSSFGYSAVSLDDLNDVGTRFTLVTLVVDVSPSTAGFLMDMEHCVVQALEACKLSPERDTFLARLVRFSARMQERFGFQPLSKIDPAGIGNILSNRRGEQGLGGLTALYDSCVNANEATRVEARRLSEADFDVNACVVVITDGEDNHSSLTAGDVRREFERLTQEEYCESVLPILVGVNVQSKSVSQYLKEFKDQGGFAQYVEIEKASKAELARLGNFIARSASAQSQSLGTGGPSKPLDPNAI